MRKFFRYVDSGVTKEIDDSQIVRCEMETYYNLGAQTLNYDVLELSIYMKEPSSRSIFADRLKLEYYIDAVKKNTFHVESAEYDNERNILKILAYDIIALLDNKFYGRFYDGYPLRLLLQDIIGDTAEYDLTEVPDTWKVSGYLPISSQREALVNVMRGTGLKLFKSDKLYFSKYTEKYPPISYNDKNIVINPKTVEGRPATEVVLKHTDYSPSANVMQVYNYTIPKNQKILVDFPEPLEFVEVFEVMADSSKREITNSAELLCIRHDNYCEITNKTVNGTIIVEGRRYMKTERTVVIAGHLQDNVIEDNPYVLLDEREDTPNSAYQIASGLLNSYKYSNMKNFLTATEPTVGYRANIFEVQRTLDGIITKVRDNFSGLYEIEVIYKGVTSNG